MLREEFERTGTTLFRWRSYLPLLGFPVLLFALRDFAYPGGDHGSDLVWEGVCFLVAMLGLAARIMTVGFVRPGTSGRNTRAPRTPNLNTTGMYSVVRHPLYLANYLMWLGVALLPRLWWPPLTISLAFWLYYERIMFAEEEFLRRSFGETYVRWASATPAFVPQLSRWRAPDSRFSVRPVVRSESSSLLAVVTSFTAVEIASDLSYTGHFVVDPAWGFVFCVAAVVYVSVLWLARRTSVLRDRVSSRFIAS